MYLFYVDETGTLDPRLMIPRKDGTIAAGDPLYVLTTVGLFEHRWHGFEKTLNRFKQELLETIRENTGNAFELADFEIKSNWVRRPSERAKHRVLSHLNADDLLCLVDRFYNQLIHHHMPIFAVVVDKACLPVGMTQEDLHRKAWELLLEMVQRYMESARQKHQALFVKDDMSEQMNRNLAMKHAHLLDRGTSNGKWLTQLCEMPHFVRSELSNGVQLADLCSYNIYRAFKDGDLAYAYFQRIKPAIWSRSERIRYPFSGIQVFPPESPLTSLVTELETSRALPKESP